LHRADARRPASNRRGGAQQVPHLNSHARERGCTHPGCDIPAYWCQVHHTKDFAKGGRTDIDEETLACGPHNRLATDGGWTTGKRPDGTTEWIPPPHLDRGQPRTNKFFHPEKMLGDDDEESGRP
jgi:hypothetical protein